MDQIKFAIAAATLAALVAPQAAASDTAKSLELRPKAALAAASIAPNHSDAPFIAPVAQGEVDFTPQREVAHVSPSSCGLQQEICYDAGHIVFKPARKLMPEIRGLTADNITVKRDRIIFRYTF